MGWVCVSTQEELFPSMSHILSDSEYDQVSYVSPTLHKLHPLYDLQTKFENVFIECTFCSWSFLQTTRFSVKQMYRNFVLMAVKSTRQMIICASVTRASTTLPHGMHHYDPRPSYERPIKSQWNILPICLLTQVIISSLSALPNTLNEG